MPQREDNILKQWWRQLVFDVPRVWTHAPSRRRVGLVLLSMVAVGAALALFWGPFAYFEYHFGGGWAGVMAAVGMYALAFGVRRSLKRRGNTLTLNLSGAPSPSLRDELLKQRTILATLVYRAAFESKATQPGGNVALGGRVRAALLQRLRQRGLWDDLSLALRDMLSEPEGSWSRERIGRVLLQLEGVRVLSWAVTENCELPPLRTASKVGPEILETALAETDGTEPVFLRSDSDIAAQVQPTRVYLARLQDELVQRGVIEGEVDAGIAGQMEAYMAYAVTNGEADLFAEDLPLGSGLVAEAGSAELMHLRGIAALRLVTLDALRQVLESRRVDPLVELGVQHIVDAVPE